MFRIACICARSAEFRDMIKRVLPASQYQVDMIDSVLDEAVRFAHKYEQTGYDLIISRGITCKMIRRAVSIPTVAIDITYFDVITALYDASLCGCDMEYFHYRGDGPRTADLHGMLRMLGIDQNRLHVHSFTTGEEVVRCLQKKSPGETVVLGTGLFVIDRASRLGFRTVTISSRQEAFLNALAEAKQLLEAVHATNVRSQQLQTLMDSFCQGLILLNTRKQVEYVTRPVLNLLRLDNDNVIGRSFQEVFGKTPLHGIFQSRSCRFAAGTGYITAELQQLFWSSESNGYAISFQFSTEKQKAAAEQRGRSSTAFVAKYALSDMLGKSAAIEQLRKKASIYGMSDMTVLICGESGTGKEILANSLHNASARRNAPFVAVNCAALPQSLLESELFGYEAGAFTGARKEGHLGLFEQANGGTIFLDEVSEISLSAQAQLLRVLQEMTIRRVGGTQSIPLDVRVIAATNVDLWERAQEGKFREDLFYRLNMLYLRIPPLRDRREDIPLLFQAFVERYKGDKALDISADGMDWLQNYDWPGNVRELVSFSQKFALLCDENQDTSQLISELLEEFSLIRKSSGAKPAAGGAAVPAPGGDRFITIPVGTMDEMELSILRVLLKRYPNMRSKMAQDLGISRTNLWKKLKLIEEQD